MKAMLIPVEGEPKRVDVEGLDDLQRLVGGNIEAFPVYDSRGWTVYVNDDGLFGSEPNRAVFADTDMEDSGYPSQMDGHAIRNGELYTVLCGPIVAVGFDAEEGTDVDLTDEQEAEIAEIFGEDGPSRPGSGLAAVVLLKLDIQVDASTVARVIG